MTRITGIQVNVTIQNKSIGSESNAPIRTAAGETAAQTTLNASATFMRTALAFQSDARRFSLERRLSGSAQTNAAASAPVSFVERHPAAQGLKFSETKSAQSLAYTARTGEIYRFPDGREWRVAETQDTPSTGFRAIVLRPVDPNDRRVIVSYAGSGAQLKDWTTNFSQAGGNTPAQYRQAVNLARKYQGSDGNNVILTGHSLGGGLASYASLQTGLRATAINSAALSPNNLGGNALFHPSLKNNPNITQYYAPGEILTDLDQIDLFDARPGNDLAIPGRYRPLDPRASIGNHLLGNLATDVPPPVKVR